MGIIVCHLANGLEDRVYRAGRYITVIRPTIFDVVKMALLVARLALCARRLVSYILEVRVRGPTRTDMERLTTFQHYTRYRYSGLG